jgi:hypothetical protein
MHLNILMLLKYIQYLTSIHVFHYSPELEPLHGDPAKSGNACARNLILAGRPRFLSSAVYGQ